jgi:hypothetical protein
MNHGTMSSAGRKRDSRLCLGMLTTIGVLEHMERKRAVVYHDCKVLQEVGHCTKHILHTEQKIQFSISSHKSYLRISRAFQTLQIF